MSVVVRTVLGDIAPTALGRVNYHEHLFQVSPLLPGDELDDETASGKEAALLRASGFDTMVDATPFGLARDPEALARISATTGLHIVATTGRHREAHYGADHPMQVWTADRLAALFLADLTRGMPVDDSEIFETPDISLARTPGGAPVRAGLLKGRRLLAHQSVRAHDADRRGRSAPRDRGSRHGASGVRHGSP